MEEAETSHKPASFWFFAIATSMLFIGCVAMITLSFMSGSRLASKSLLQGQRAIVSFSSGLVEGQIFKEPVVSAAAEAAPKIETPKVLEPVAIEPVVPNPNLPPLATDASSSQMPLTTPPKSESSSETPNEPQTFAPVMAIPQIGRGMQSLSLAPFAPLTEKVGDFTLPRIDVQNKQIPWQYYAKAITAPSKPMVAVVITGLGQSRSTTNAVLELAPSFTLSFSPYAKDSPLWVINARNKGFESWVDLPVEPADYPASDPGPHAILTDKIIDDNVKNLHWTLSRFQGFSGVVVPSYEKFTTSESLGMAILKELSARGVQMNYVQNSLNADFTKQAKSAKQLIIPSNTALDESLSQTEILIRLQALSEKAKKEGYASGQIRAFPVSLEALKVWTSTLKDSGVELVPLSAIAQKIQ